MHPQEYPDPPAGQAGQEPRLPARPRPVQAAPAQLLTRRQELRLASRGGQRDPDMISDVKGRRVHPQRPAQARRGAGGDPDRLNLEPAVTVCQAGSVLSSSEALA
jgi:hypothetical protein